MAPLLKYRHFERDDQIVDIAPKFAQDVKNQSLPSFVLIEPNRG
jgi:hypothetical protein